MLAQNFDNLNRWRQEAEIDYFAYFIKAYIPFNSWFKITYPTVTHERDIISNIKSGGNLVHSTIVPLLSGSDDDALRFKSYVGLLHERLERHQIVNPKKGRVVLSNCHVADNAVTNTSGAHHRVNYVVERNVPHQGRITCEVRTTRATVFNAVHNKYDLAMLENDPAYASLTVEQRSQLKGRYQQINPFLMVDLTNQINNVPRIRVASLPGSMPRHPTIAMGHIQFCDNPEYIFAGLVEVIYNLRNLLFHGVIVPTNDHNEVYEPAYFILRRFLRCIV